VIGKDRNTGFSLLEVYEIEDFRIAHDEPVPENRLIIHRKIRLSGSPP